jgi:RNA polymerase sigma-70 factor (ECF subfamily)
MTYVDPLPLHDRRKDPAPSAATAPDAPMSDPREDLPTHIPALRAFAISLTRNATEADDLVQETIMKAWSNFDKFQQGTELKAWLFTILRNTFFSSKRKTKREVSDPEGVHAGSLFEKPHHDGRLAMAEFSRAFDQLSPEHREILILVGANGYSYQEAADMTGVAAGTAKSRASRARARLCDLLGLDEGEGIVAEQTGATMAVLGRSGQQG